MQNEAQKAAVVRLAAKDMRDHVASTPLERQVMRELIDLQDCSLAILFNAFERTNK